jgi:arylsulfatase A-like enzyme
MKSLIGYIKKRILLFTIIGFIIACLIFFFLLKDRIHRFVSEEKIERPLNVALILVDALRADSLGCYGYSRNTSPNLDAFVQDSILFDSARSQATCTFASVNSIMTSRYTLPFIIRKNQGIPEDMPYLPSILKKLGYTTVAISSSPIVRNTPSKYNPDAGFGRGFDVFQEFAWQKASTVNEAAFKELEKIEQPFFLFLHYMDTHDHYMPPEAFKNKFCPPYDGKDFIKNGNPNPIAEMLYGNGAKFNLTPEDIGYLKALYDSEIAYFDSEFKNLLDRLSVLGYLKNTLIVFCADHGEEFMEHNHVKHCRSVFEVEQRVPMIWRFPGGDPRGRRKALVQNLDIVPTIIDYLGADWKNFGFEGKSLRPTIEKDQEIHSYVFCAQSSLRSITDSRYKLILDMASGDLSLYDLQTDPNESQNLAKSEPERVRKMIKPLLDWQSAQEAGLTREESLRLSQEVEERLRSLGYLK